MVHVAEVLSMHCRSIEAQRAYLSCILLSSGSIQTPSFRKRPGSFGWFGNFSFSASFVIRSALFMALPLNARINRKANMPISQRFFNVKANLADNFPEFDKSYEML
jgi:hypothetical protein